MQTLFVFSDAHLGAPGLDDDAQRQQAVIDFLHYAADEGGTICIAGDLFEFWFEYKQAIPRQNFPVLACLYELASAGREIHYLRGNHDLWLDSFFREEIGVITHGEETRFSIGAFDVFVTHGDGRAAPDKGYRRLKYVMQNRYCVAFYRLLHPDIGIPFAKKMSQVSRNKSFADDPWAEDYRNFARQKFAEGANVVLLGHTHRAVHELNGSKHYVNLGDWIAHYSYCRIDPQEVSLRQWPTHDVYIAPTATF